MCIRDRLGSMAMAFVKVSIASRNWRAPDCATPSAMKRSTFVGSADSAAWARAMGPVSDWERYSTPAGERYCTDCAEAAVDATAMAMNAEPSRRPRDNFPPASKRFKRGQTPTESNDRMYALIRFGRSLTPIRSKRTHLTRIAGRRVRALMRDRRASDGTRTPHHEHADQPRADAAGDRRADRCILPRVRQRSGRRDVGHHDRPPDRQRYGPRMAHEERDGGRQPEDTIDEHSGGHRLLQRRACVRELTQAVVETHQPCVQQQQYRDDPCCLPPHPTSTGIGHLCSSA